MAAKPGKKKVGKPAPGGGSPAPVEPPLAAGNPGEAASPPAAARSPGPPQTLVGKVVLAGVWLYVAALWLLALDQTFGWGIFGPTQPALP